MTDGTPDMDRSGKFARPRILLLGASGQVGWELARALSPFADAVTPGRDRLDLARPESLKETVRELAPACIVNAAAYTEVDRAESERGLAFRVNAVAPGVLAEEALRVGALLVHYSTDYVFDGEAGRPYTESSVARPLNAYGESKLAGERAILDVGGPSLIFRTSWVYGRRRANFLNTIRRLARERDRIEVVDDQVGAPTWCRELVDATVRILLDLQDGAAFSLPAARGGLFHLSAGGQASWYEFATAILERDPQRASHRCSDLLPVRSDDYAAEATRPRYTVLDNARVADRYGIVLSPWRSQLDRALA